MRFAAANTVTTIECKQLGLDMKFGLNARQAMSSVHKCILIVCKFTANVHEHLRQHIKKRLGCSNLDAKDRAAKALSTDSKTKQVIRGPWIPKLHRICRKHAALPEIC